eukprot:m.124543 g.124543  ORF g.124543 m.124543 type:complete len:368 (-) comp29065_c0_seq5:585-1688(-)
MAIFLMCFSLIAVLLLTNGKFWPMDPSPVRQAIRVQIKLVLMCCSSAWILALPSNQAFNSSQYTSWGGSVVMDDNGRYNMFVAVFANHSGLGKWTSTSEIMHAVADTPDGPFTPTTNGPKNDGIIAGPEAHNPTIVRANDGTWLLFSIGRSPLLVSQTIDGPWSPSPFTKCNNPAPVVIPESDTIYVYCHGGPDLEHWGTSIGLVWAEHWNTTTWHVFANNTEDLFDGGTSLFTHPVEDPFAWYSNGMFHLLMHGFRMGMVDATVTNDPSDSPRCGDSYGSYARAPTPFGPWTFQENAVAYRNILKFNDSTSLALNRRERPHLFFDKNGNPTHLYNGVCPQGNTEGNNGFANHCFTAVQRIASTHRS